MPAFAGMTNLRLGFPTTKPVPHPALHSQELARATLPALRARRDIERRCGFSQESRHWLSISLLTSEASGEGPPSAAEAGVGSETTRCFKALNSRLPVPSKHRR